MTAIDHTFFETNVHCLISTFAYMEEHDFDDKKLNSVEELTNLVVHGMLFSDGIPFIAQSFKKFVESLGGVAAFRSRPMYEYSIHAVAAIYFMTMPTRCRRTSSLPTMNQAQAAKIYGDLFKSHVDNRSVEARVVRRICRSPRTNYCIDYYECNNLYQEIKPDESKRVTSLLKEKIKTIVLIETSPTNLNDFGGHYLCKNAPSKFRKSYRHESPQSPSSQSRSQLGAPIKTESALDELNQLMNEISPPNPRANQEVPVASLPLRARKAFPIKSRASREENDNLQESSDHSIDNCTRILEVPVVSPLKRARKAFPIRFRASREENDNLQESSDHSIDNCTRILEVPVVSPLKRARKAFPIKSRASREENDNLQESSDLSIDNCTRILRSDVMSRNEEAPLRLSETPLQTSPDEVDENIIACISSDITSLYTSLLAHRNGMSSASFIENISLCLARMIKLLGVNFRYQIELTPSDIIKMLPTGLFEENSSIIKQGRCCSPVPSIPQNLSSTSSSFESRIRDSLSTNSGSLAGQTGSHSNRFYATNN